MIRKFIQIAIALLGIICGLGLLACATGVVYQAFMVGGWWLIPAGVVLWLVFQLTLILAFWSVYK